MRFPILPCSALILILPATAQVTANWTGTSDQEWHNALNWDTGVIPTNIGVNTYNAFLGGGAGLVSVDANTTIEGLTTQVGASLSIDDGRTFTVRDDVLNGGEIHLEGDNNISRFSISDSSGGLAVQISGNGTIHLDDSFDQISGTIDHLLHHIGNHTIRGHGNLGGNSIRINNSGSVIADNPGETLLVQPRTSFDNSGSLWARNGGELELLTATYTNTGPGELSVDDGSEIRLNGATIQDGTIAILDLNGSPSDNRLEVIGNSTLTDVTVETATHVDNGRTLTLTGTNFTNHGLLHLDSSVNTSRLSFNGSVGNTMTFGGTGTLFLDGGNDHVSGTIAHTLVHAAGHRIEGHGQLGQNSISITNQGTIDANVAGQALIVDPYSDFLVDGGSLLASGGGTSRFLVGNYGVANGGRFIIGDGSTFELQGGTWSDLTLEIDDQDADPANHFVEINSGTTFNRVTNEAVLSVANGLTLTLNESFTNQQRIELNQTTNATRLSFADASDQQADLDGTGLIRLDSSLDQITGSNFQTLRQGPDHSITGGGSIGQNAINLLNEGSIVADLPGQPLIIDPQGTFRNDGGSLHAGPSSQIRLLAGTYDAVNGGTYTVGEDAEMRLEGITMRDLTLAVDDSDGDLLDHHARVVTNTNFERVTNELALAVEEGRTLTLREGDFTNTGTITLEGGTNASSLAINGTGVGNAISILGDGQILLDHPLDSVAGSNFHQLIHGPDHSISGFGRIGLNSINVRNQGTIESSVAGQTLTFDPQSSFINDGGTLHAADLAVIRFENATYSAMNGGIYSIGEDALLEINSATLEDLTLTAANTSGTFENHFANMISNSTFRRVTNGLALTVNDARTLTLAGGDFTNNGEIQLDGTTNASSISINGTGVDNTITIGGTGSIQLDGTLDRITGSNNHLLVQGPGHRTEGHGRVGNNNVFIRNEGLMNANQSGMALELDVRSGSLDNRGTLQAENGVILDIKDPVSDTGGTMAPRAGSTIQVNHPITQSLGTTAVDGTLAATSLTLEKSLLKGTGLVNNPVDATFSTVAPGNSTGTLTIDDATTLGTGTSLAIEVNATADHDVLAITSSVLQLNGGTLSLDYLGGPTDVSGSDTLTIVTSTGGISGEFLNVADGERLYTVSGVASFVVNYLTTSITLTDFIYNPAGPPNEAPVFTASVENLNIDENTPVGTLLTTFAAYDPEGVPIEFTLSGIDPPFAIDLLNGELRVSDLVNHEEAAVHNLTINASDTVQASGVLLTITVNDLIDTNSEIVEDILTDTGGPFEGETDPAIIAYDADPDHDGRINLFELWRGTDPAVTDLETPALLEPYFVLGEDRGSVTVSVDSAIDDQLAIDAELSFDLSDWRVTTPNREILSDTGGVRTLRFFDTVALGSESSLFARFRAEADGEP